MGKPGLGGSLSLLVPASIAVALVWYLYRNVQLSLSDQDGERASDRNVDTCEFQNKDTIDAKRVHAIETGEATIETMAASGVACDDAVTHLASSDRAQGTASSCCKAALEAFDASI